MLTSNGRAFLHNPPVLRGHNTLSSVVTTGTVCRPWFQRDLHREKGLRSIKMYCIVLHRLVLFYYTSYQHLSFHDHDPHPPFVTGYRSSNPRFLSSVSAIPHPVFRVCFLFSVFRSLFPVSRFVKFLFSAFRILLSDAGFLFLVSVSRFPFSISRDSIFRFRSCFPYAA